MFSTEETNGSDQQWTRSFFSRKTGAFKASAALDGGHVRVRVARTWQEHPTNIFLSSGTSMFHWLEQASAFRSCRAVRAKKTRPQYPRQKYDLEIWPQSQSSSNPDILSFRIVKKISSLSRDGRSNELQVQAKTTEHWKSQSPASQSQLRSIRQG